MHDARMTDDALVPAQSAAWAPGFYDDGHGMRRWWTGRAWTADADPQHIAAPEVRQRNLDQALARLTAAGWSIEFRSADQAVVSRPIPMSLLGNLIGVLLTGGLWLIYVLVRLGSPQSQRRTLAVHPNGTVLG